jgi:hypothetical protein
VRRDSSLRRVRLLGGGDFSGLRFSRVGQEHSLCHDFHRLLYRTIKA